GVFGAEREVRRVPALRFEDSASRLNETRLAANRGVVLMPRVFISDKLEAGGAEMLQQAGLEVDNRPGLKDAALQQALQAADGMVVRSGTRVTAALLDN